MAKSNRRAFLIGAGAAIAAPFVLRGPSAAPPDPLRPPDHIAAFHQGSSTATTLVRSGSRWQADDIELALESRKQHEVALLLTAPK
jgi:hypothetical protein